MTWFLTLLMGSAVYAYIPEYSLIAARTADQHGKNSYWVEQDVTYRKDGEAFTVRESWIVNNENSMRLTVEGRGALKGLVQGTMLFEGGQKFFADANGGGSSARTQHLGEDWLEPLFHFRNSKYFRNRLVTLKVAPPESLHDRPPLSSEGDLKDIKYEAPSFLRLSRVGGVTAWAIGVPPTTGTNPTVWIEQDEFVLRKYHGANQVILRANDYHKFDEGLWFPRQRLYTYGNFTVEVLTLQVKSLGKLRPDDPRFRRGNLTPAHDGLRLPDVDALREFYSRFR